MLDGLTVAGMRAERAFHDEPSVLGRLRSTMVAGLLFACAGGALAFTALPLFDSGYEASTRLTLARTDQAAVLAATRAVKSRQSLDNIVRALDLARTEGFAVNDPALYAIVSELLSGSETTMAEAEQALRDRLLEAMSVTYDAASRSVAITVTAADRAEATAIANRLADEFRRALIATAVTAPSPQVEALQKTNERAQAALTGFSGKYDAAGLARLRSYQEERRLSDIDTAAAEQQLAGLKTASDLASAMTTADVLNEPLPDSLEFTGLEYQRQRYVQSQLALEHVSAELGPRHPRRMAAQAAFDDAKSDLAKALRQLVASLEAQVKSAETSLAGLKSGRRGLLADTQLAADVNQFELLETAAAEARRNLDRAEANSAVSTPATLPRLDPVTQSIPATSRAIGPDPAMIIYGGAAAGFVLGAAFAIPQRRRQMRMAEDVYELETELDVLQPAYVSPPLVEISPVAAYHDAMTSAPETHAPQPVEPEPVWREEREWAQEQDWRDETANDMAFGDRMRALLMTNSVPAEQTALPPLLSAVVQYSLERVEEAQAHGWLDDNGYLPDFDEDELLALQRELELLRELAALHEDREFRLAS